MSKGTIILCFTLAIVAALLLGINLGKNIDISPIATSPTVSYQPTKIIKPPTLTPINTLSPSIPVSASATIFLSPTLKQISYTTYTNSICGFSFSYPGSFIQQKTTNEQSIIYTDPDNSKDAIAATCASSIPKPLVSADKTESILLGGRSATLYHDQNPDGSPRDEVIVKNPNNGLEIILAGYGSTFFTALTSFKFVQ
jgi:hypothetical protein